MPSTIVPIESCRSKPDSPQLSAAQMIAAREWISDCQWREVVDDPGFAWTLTDDQVERAIERHYEGGTVAFIATCSS